ncbi:MAG: FRG domain-containing protein [Syntrophobacteraceae bacterium]
MFAETKIDGWESIQRFFSALSKSHSQWIFRGHTNADWLLDTSLQRSAHIYEISPQSLTVIERIMLDRFKRTAHHFLRYSPNDEDDIEWLSIFQHHGGITRLLDFTRSFYVALFFALDFSSTDACVWCVSKRRLEDRAIEVLEPGNYGKINFKRDITYNEGRETAQLFVGHDIGTSVVIPVIPYRLNERMSIQQGICLFPTNLCASLEDNLYSMFDVHSMDFKPPNWLMNDYDDYNVIKLIAPVDCHKDILTDLYRMNITAASLFPGLDGYARSLKYILRDPMNTA